MGTSKLSMPMGDSCESPRFCKYPRLSYRMDEPDRSNYVYNNHFLQPPNTPTNDKNASLVSGSFGIFQKNYRLTFWPKLFFMVNLLFVSNPVNASRSSTFCLTNSWSIVVRYSSPGGQPTGIRVAAGIFIQPPVRKINKRKKHCIDSNRIEVNWTFVIPCNEQSQCQYRAEIL